MFFVADTIKNLLGQFEEIPVERREVLKTLAAYVNARNGSNLIFICTHNSRRSHISQIWARTAASYFDIPDVGAFSGGTETTALDRRVIHALCGIGFKIELTSGGANPRYSVRYSDVHPAFLVFSKKYDDPENPTDNFAAIMTCAHADKDCPVVVGANTRISLPYDDPKDFDGTDLESIRYRERSLEIGREILFAFSKMSRR